MNAPSIKREKEREYCFVWWYPRVSPGSPKRRTRPPLQHHHRHHRKPSSSPSITIHQPHHHQCCDASITKHTPTPNTIIWYCSAAAQAQRPHRLSPACTINASEPMRGTIEPCSCNFQAVAADFCEAIPQHSNSKDRMPKCTVLSIVQSQLLQGGHTAIARDALWRAPTKTAF